MLFFLLYFSPIFFFKKPKTTQEDISHLFSFELSPQKSLIIPLTLTYLGVYILAFTFSGNISESIHMHLVIFLAIFCIFLGYIFSFSWKNDVFFDVLGFHLLFSYITLSIVGIYYFFFRETLGLLDLIFAFVTAGFSYFFFLFETKYRKEFFYCFLVTIFFVTEFILLYLFPNISLYTLFGAFGLLAIIFFEHTQKSRFFEPFFQLSRVFFLIIVLLSTAILSLSIFWNFESIYFLLLFVVFLFSIHIRFSNIISYIFAIFVVYWLYWYIFFSLLWEKSVTTSLIFIYFLPMLMIMNTYFWKEKQKYDFAILHYASIIFSALFFVYSLIFLKWWEWNFLFSSFGMFLLAGLFFLSYFRFRNK